MCVAEVPTQEPECGAFNIIKKSIALPQQNKVSKLVFNVLEYILSYLNSLFLLHT